MAADKIENYEGHPAFSFIETVPTNFEKTVVLDAKIGSFLTIARKDRYSDDWYVGSATDENPRDITVNFSFLTKTTSMSLRCFPTGQEPTIVQIPIR